MFSSIFGLCVCLCVMQCRRLNDTWIYGFNAVKWKILTFQTQRRLRIFVRKKSFIIFVWLVRFGRTPAPNPFSDQMSFAPLFTFVVCPLRGNGKNDQRYQFQCSFKNKGPIRLNQKWEIFHNRQT